MLTKGKIHVQERLNNLPRAHSQWAMGSGPKVKSQIIFPGFLKIPGKRMVSRQGVEPSSEDLTGNPCLSTELRLSSFPILGLSFTLSIQGQPMFGLITHSVASVWELPAATQKQARQAAGS